MVACKLRGNPYVELAHWFDQLLRQAELDVPCTVRAFELQPEKVATFPRARSEQNMRPRWSTTIPSTLSSWRR